MMIIHHEGLTNASLTKLPYRIRQSYRDELFEVCKTRDWAHFRSLMKELDLQIAITSNGRADRRLENMIENLAQTTNTVKIFHGTEIVFRMSKPAGLKGYPELCIEAISTLEEYRAEQRRLHYEALLPTKEDTTRGATKI